MYLAFIFCLPINFFAAHQGPVSDGLVPVQRTVLVERVFASRQSVNVRDCFQQAVQLHDYTRRAEATFELPRIPRSDFWMG